MREISFLGTGGASPTRERDSTSFLLESGRAKVLVDCPGSVLQKIRKLNVDPREINAILVTHIHPDHIYGLPSLVHGLMLEEGAMTLFGSEESVLFCQKLLDLFGLQEEKIKMRIDWRRVSSHQEFEAAESVLVRPLRIPHHSSSLGYHFYLEEREWEMIFTGDTPLYTTLFEQAENVECLIHDCSAPSRFFEEYPVLQTMHTHSRELGEWSQKANVKCLIPCHFFGEVDFSLDEIEKEIRETYSGKLIVPHDFDRIRL